MKDDKQRAHELGQAIALLSSVLVTVVFLISRFFR
jgi:hypothetical protein